MSKLCDDVKLVLEQTFPHMKIKREEFVQYKNQKLFLDLWLPQLGLVVEVHGRQHDEYVDHFHGNVGNFRDSKKRDRIKEEWASVNNYTYLVIREKDFPLDKTKILEMIDAASKSNG